jgi:putative DNA primase/helicase
MACDRTYLILNKETAGVMLWALEGLRRLREAGEFTRPAASEDLLRQFSRLSSPALAFLEDRCVLGPHRSVPVDNLWEAWKKWCLDNGAIPGGKASFGEHLRSVNPGITKRRLGSDGDRRMVYAGIDVETECPI